MKHYYLKKIISVTGCLLLSALFILTLFFSAPKITAVPEAKGEITEIVYADGTANKNVYTMGKDFTAVRINDLGNLGKITQVNFVAEKFVAPGTLSPEMQIVDLTKPFDFTEKGTLIFVIANLDPQAEDFDEQTQSLSEYKMGDYWHFHLALPNIFSASNVYQKANLIAQHGEIENYDFIEYNTNYDKKTENFSSQTDTTYIDLQFYTRREVLVNSVSSAQIITVHYQSTGSAYSGIKDCPLIGTKNAVKSINEHSTTLLSVFGILAVVVFAVLTVLSLLKRTKEFIPAIIWILGITILLLSRFLLIRATGAPLLWVAFGLASSFCVLVGALLSVSRNFGKLPVKMIFPALAAVGAALAFLSPFVPFGAASVLEIICIVIKGVCTIALSGLIALSTFRKDDENGILKLVCAAIIATALVASFFMPQVSPAHFNPIFWLCAVTIVVTFVSVFMVFKETEKANEFLTANLHLEVERQIKDIRAVISERDKLLQFVSHDMKKPLDTAVTLSDTAIGNEQDGEQVKTLQIIRQNCARVVNNLSEIASYAKFNYLAEPSQVVDLSELCALLFKYHKLDCDANGIILKNTVDVPAKAFAKKQGLENVLSDLIINAVEHANCKTITMSIKSDKNRVVLCVIDDGKGIEAGLDVFAPYVSENDAKTGGVGLYICKNIIESMNGELTYDNAHGGTTFYVSLLKA